MLKILELFGDGMALFYSLLGGISAAVMCILRSIYQQSRKTMKVRLCEALMCSMLASSLTILVHFHLGWDYEYAMPIGTLVGFLGVDFISAVLIGRIKYGKFGLPEDKGQDETR